MPTQPLTPWDIPDVDDVPPIVALIDKHSKTRATLRGIRVHCAIKDLLADVKVDFRFRNSGTNPIEALYATELDAMSSG